MKKIISLALLFVIHNNFAQNTFPSTGNVGIGTTAPDAKLNVVGNINIDNVDWSTDNELRIREGGSNSYGAFFKYGVNDILAIGTRHIDVDYTAMQISRGSLNTVFNGNVGVGIANPSMKLEVIGNESLNFDAAGFFNAKSFGNVNDKCETRINLGKIEGNIRRSMGAIGAFPLSNTDSSNGILAFYTRESASLLERLRIISNGNVGIGTTSPSAKLDIFGNAGEVTNIIMSADYPTSHRWRLKTIDRGYAIDMDFTSSNSADEQEAVLKLSRSNSGRPEFQLYNNTIVANDGNVGIGTANPTNKLDVNGTIHSKEVKVDMNGWSDFVFNRDYVLPTLQEVEKHIAEKGHLENIPSEEEVLKNGINLGEMNSKLLQKIEELTLYMIQMKKENEIIKKENAEIKKENMQVKTMQTELESRIKELNDKIK